MKEGRKTKKRKEKDKIPFGNEELKLCSQRKCPREVSFCFHRLQLVGYGDIFFLFSKNNGLKFKHSKN